MSANPEERPYLKACSELKRASHGLRALKKALQESKCTGADLVDSLGFEMKEEQGLKIDLTEFVVLARDISGKHNDDYTLKLSSEDVQDLIPLLEALNTPDVWPIGREVRVKIAEGVEWQRARIAAYSNHYDWLESAYPIYVQITLRYLSDGTEDKEQDK